MPICPRCGKSLSSEQALSYHMNKKFKCGTWKCMKCSKQFDTKFALNIHEMNCIESRYEYPSFDLLRLLYYNLDIIVYELDINNRIKNVNPAYYKKHSNDIIGQSIDLNNPSYKVIEHNDSKLVVLL